MSARLAVPLVRRWRFLRAQDSHLSRYFVEAPSRRPGASLTAAEKPLFRTGPRRHLAYACVLCG